MAAENDKQEDKLAQPYDLSEIVRKARAQTPARLLAGRSGAAYRTQTQLELRAAHAAARDAVRAELDLFTNPNDDFAQKWNLFETASQARNKNEYLLRPDLGRHFNVESNAEIRKRCLAKRDLHVVIGDGLSVSAITAQVPHLLPLLSKGAKNRGWSFGEVFVIRYCRVGILNEIGAPRCRPANRRTPRLGHCRKPLRIHGLPPEGSGHRRESQPDLKHSRSRRKHRTRGEPHPEPRGVDDEGSYQRLPTPGGISSSRPT